MGTDLHSFSIRYYSFHHYYHRHFLEYFNKNSGLFLFVYRILRCYTIEEYDERPVQILVELENFIKRN